MTKAKCVSIVLLILQAFFFPKKAPESEEPVDWSYEGATGPEFWNTINPDYIECGPTNLRQSPININSTITTNGGSGNLGAIVQSCPSLYYAEKEPNNYAFRCRIPGSCGSITINSKSYDMVQFHIHARSEHEMEGRQEDFEIHLVHSNDEGELAVLGILLRAEDTANAVDVSKAIAAISSEKPFAFDFNSVFDGSSGYYSFVGGLTVPPCVDEAGVGIQWIVQKEIGRITSSQVAEFIRLVGPVPRGNFRPPQEINDRVITLVDSNTR
eukprot:Plantae.Rhodophyta-Hildenbrandia_rubra.ctg3451.p1 GENE.Plantae.Rhodophyta-Hildenbrandia_rubra.ctg3451~~Plantae.Rhodophyta-Hildenbrandia_rubra.ctg3451.p1  ORF type:complete len:269 (+),score=29.76 Plantae.Rhodophyta-Hildenbrandia_rubra.ctg3451:2217-3023(+)